MPLRQRVGMSTAIEHRTHMPFGDGLLQLGSFDVMRFNQLVDPAFTNYVEVNLGHLTDLFLNGHLSDKRFNIDGHGKCRSSFFGWLLSAAAQSEKKYKNRNRLLHTFNVTCLSCRVFENDASPKRWRGMEPFFVCGVPTRLSVTNAFFIGNV